MKILKYVLTFCIVHANVTNTTDEINKLNLLSLYISDTRQVTKPKILKNKFKILNLKNAMDASVDLREYMNNSRLPEVQIINRIFISIESGTESDAFKLSHNLELMIDLLLKGLAEKDNLELMIDLLKGLEEKRGKLSEELAADREAKWGELLEEALKLLEEALKSLEWKYYYYSEDLSEDYQEEDLSARQEAQTSS